MNLENGDETDSESTTRIHSGLQRAALIMTAYSALDQAANDAQNACGSNTLLSAASVPVHIERPPENPPVDPADSAQGSKEIKPPVGTGQKITEQEWRDMLAAVRHLPNNRGTILLMLFRHCVGKISLNVPITTLRAVKKERVKSVQDVGSLLAEINQQFRNRKKTPFLLYRTPAYGPITGYTLERRPIASSGRDRGRRSRKEIETDRKAANPVAPDKLIDHATETELPMITSSARLSIDPNHSDLSKDQWLAVGKLLDEHAEDWNWHPLLQHIFESRPNPVPLVELDAIAKGCGNSYQYAWGTAIVQVNKWLQKKDLPCRIMRQPSERVAGFKKSHNIYEGNVTLYLLPQS